VSLSFREIEGYEGRYIIHFKGIIYSSATGKPLSQHINRHGYKTVSLYNGVKQRTFKVHRLVAETFLGYYAVPNKHLQVNHIDGIKTNNDVNNLEFVTRSENAKHAYRLGLQCKKGINNGRSSLDELDVKTIRSSDKTVAQLAEHYEVSKSTINRAKNGTTWSHIE
jgi:hypothetical protein